MSYILEALKKAEAERQLGSAPSVHVPQVAGASSRDTRRSRMALWAALSVLGAGAAIFAYLKWPAAQRSAPQPVVVAAAPVPVVPPAPPSAAVFTAAPAPAQVAAPPVVAAPAPEPAPVRPAPAPVVAAPPPPPPAPAPEESYPFLRDLPEAVTRELPQVAIGGYIYSKNPADRLLLVDKVLRREGEEVAPGLTLERLLPKAAVLNYRGVRYRVAY